MVKYTCPSAEPESRSGSTFGCSRFPDQFDLAQKAQLGHRGTELRTQNLERDIPLAAQIASTKDVRRPAAPDLVADSYRPESAFAQPLDRPPSAKRGSVATAPFVGVPRGVSGTRLSRNLFEPLETTSLRPAY
jgi:hypothetical protein